ncbi:MAG: OmpH family outer membrane protein [Sphingomicrobium sp.]
MKTLLISAAAITASILPSAASAQAIPGAVVAVVDLEKVTSECNACKTAAAALRSQATALQSRQTALATPLETEGKSIQAAIDALPQGKEPDAALQNRAKAWQSKRDAAAQEITRGEEQLRRNQAYINQQVRDKLGPIYQQVMQRRGANIMVETGSTLATSTSVDVSNDVLSALNAAMPTIATQAPAQTTTQRQQPQGR